MTSTFALLFFCIQAFLVQNAFSQCSCSGLNAANLPGLGYNTLPNLAPVGNVGSCGNLADLNAASIGLNTAGLGLNNAGLGLNNAGFGLNTASLGVNTGYGGYGNGDVVVLGDLPVFGSTLVTGQVPVLGAVQFNGMVPAHGTFSVCGKCECGCNGFIIQ